MTRPAPTPERDEAGAPPKVLGAAGAIALALVAVRVCGLGRDVVLAATLGTGDDLDAYLVAMLVPDLVVTIAAASLTPALVPELVRIRERGDADTGTVGQSTGFLLLALALGAALLAIAARWLVPVIAGGFAESKIARTVDLMYWLLPTMLLTGVTVVWGAALNARRSYVPVALVPALGILVSLATFVALRDRLGVHALVAGAYAGAVIHAVVLGVLAARRGIRVLPAWPRAQGSIRAVLREAAPACGATVLGTGITLVDQAFAARLAPGSVAVLTFGLKVPSAVATLAAAALGTAALPGFASLAARGTSQALRTTVLRLRAQALVGLALVATVVAAVSVPLTRLLFERDAFTTASTGAVAAVQAVAALHIPFLVAGVIVARALSAARLNRVLLLVSAVSFVLNFVLDWVLSAALGVPGIALATAAMYAVSLVLLSVAFHRVVPPQK